MNDERFTEWFKLLLEENEIQSIDELTPDMLIEAIQNAEDDIDNQETWEMGSTGTAAACHRSNIADLQDYILLLEGMIPETHTIEFILGIYEDPDMLPKRIVFLVPETIDYAALKGELTKAKDKIVAEMTDACIEEMFVPVLNETCALIGPHSRWRYEPLESLHGKENLWGM